MDQPSILLQARQWSASTLEVGTNCGTAELLQRVTRDDYMVSPERIDAMQLLVNPQAFALITIVAQSAVEMGMRATMEAAVAGFANSFFEIPPDQRQQQWQSLQQECQAFPELQQWLNHLEPALHLLHIPETDDESSDAFVKLCCQSFVARDPERARRRQAIIHMYLHEPCPSQSVIADLQADHREFVTAVVPWLPELQTLFLAEVAEHSPLVLPYDAETRSDKSEFGWWAGYALGFIPFVVMFAAAMNNQLSSKSLLEEIKSTNPQHRIQDIRWGLKVEDAKDNPELLRAARLATKILLGQDVSNESPSEDDDELPADALKPDQPASHP